MANQLSPEKEKIVYAEFTEVLDELAKKRMELSEKEGREISQAEMLRRIHLWYVNQDRTKRGEKKLNLDPTSAPGGMPPAPRRHASA